MSGAAVLGIFWQQLAGIGHDLGHSGVTHDFYLDHIIGSVLSAFMGLSVGWWKSDHNTHHVVCNAIEHDPNIQHMPMLAITQKIFRVIASIGMCWMLGSCSMALHTTWCVLWSDFHQPTERPMKAERIEPTTWSV